MPPPHAAMMPPEAGMMPPEAGMMPPEGDMMAMGPPVEEEEDALALMMENEETEEDYILLEDAELSEHRGPVTLPQGTHDTVVQEICPSYEEDVNEEVDITEEDLAEIVEALTVDARPVPSGVPGGGTNNADLEEYVDETIAQEENELAGALVPGKGIKVNHQIEQALSENKTLKSLNKKHENRLTNLEEKNNNYRDLLEKLKVRLEEVNLVNAKLLYTNRALNSDSLNERQKNNVVEAISKVQSVEEAKIVYETLQSTVGARKRKRAPQSLSEAVQRSSTILPRRNNVVKPSDPISDRWKVLAGINNKEK